ATLEKKLAQQADVLTVYGSETTLAAWRDHVPATTRLLAHGHKLSVGLVSAAALDARQSTATARQAAFDVLRWDQHGCYSAQAFYVERGGQISPEEFAQQLAGELSARQHQFKRRTPSLEEARNIGTWRQAMTIQ